jgi:uncharacterized membrane protein
MTYFQQNCDTLIGLFLIIVGICTFIFPPKFANPFYGIITRWTLKNETVWAAGQKFFAKSIIIIGLIFFIISNFNLREDLPSFSMVLLLIVLWNLSKYLVHKILERKYPTVFSVQGSFFTNNMIL